MSVEAQAAGLAAPNEKAFGLLAQLAATIGGRDRLAANPAAGAALAERAGGGIPAEAFAAMLATPSFGRHLAPLVIGTGQAISCSEGLPARIAGSEESRLCLLLVNGTEQKIAPAVELVAAAVMQRRFLAAVTRRQREAIAEAFSEPARKLGLSEAPLLYPRLAELDAGGMTGTGLPVREIGLGALAAFVGRLEPELESAFRLRAGESAEDHIATDRFDDVHARLIRKLLARKFPQWTQLIS
jgi:hypothetical protein